MIFGITGIAILLAIYAPSLWVRWVMSRHCAPIPGMPGTGGDFARHLIEMHGLDGVEVELTEQAGDHYSPTSKTVRLSPSNYEGRSLTAVAVAAHEVGHAIQDRDGNVWIDLRTRLYPRIQLVEKIAVIALSAIPVVTILARTPAAGALMLVAGLTLFLARVFFHAVTLPMEWDASFGKALPIIIDGRYVAPGEERAIQQVLRAAALTYVAAALADILSFWRWIAIFRGRWI